MLLYKDEFNDLQYKPYRKIGSHQERIPWISHHPLDVKRGTFIGEMSRLATLSSTSSCYKEAMQSLTALYITRGYPADLVYKWLKDNITERWNKRLYVRPQNNTEVLVLKTEFNTAWNYFNATKLGDTILGFWRDWIVHAEEGRFSVFFPQYSDDTGSVLARPELTTLVGANAPFVIPDIRKINILNRRMIVSRKRTRNLFDLTTLWKNTVISHMENDLQTEEPPSGPVNIIEEPTEEDENRLNEEAFDNLFEPWPTEDDEEIPYVNRRIRTPPGDLSYIFR